MRYHFAPRERKCDWCGSVVLSTHRYGKQEICGDCKAKEEEKEFTVLSDYIFRKLLLKNCEKKLKQIEERAFQESKLPEILKRKKNLWEEYCRGEVRYREWWDKDEILLSEEHEEQERIEEKLQRDSVWKTLHGRIYGIIVGKNRICYPSHSEVLKALGFADTEIEKIRVRDIGVVIPMSIYKGLEV